MDDAILTLQELPSLLADPERRERFSPLTEQPFLLFDAAAGTPPADVGTLAALGELACPVIAILPSDAPVHST
ncbi:MAG TPA: hypothetical protein PLN78_09425, partial [Pseudomonadales bacterium]|nr:hypothetical protein [Pseudomonadales bacterium]